MENAHIIKVFLASPSDVAKERGYIARVITEVNRDVALQYNMVLHLISSERASPGFGKDGQAMLNEKIGSKMQGYDLFLGVMWSRIGKRTPRAISGTVEEFRRAERAFRAHGKPEIWFFFRDAPIPADDQDQLDQKSRVLKFKQELQGKSFTKSYRTYIDLKDKLREHLIKLLFDLNQQPPNDRKKAPRKSSTPIEQTKVPSPKIAAKPTVTRNPVGSSRKPVASRPRAHSTGITKNADDWAMVGQEFYRLKTDKVQKDRTIVLQLSPLSVSQAAQLRSLQPDNFARTREIACAYGREASVLQVQTVESETTAGEATVTLTLSPMQRPNSGILGMDFTYQNFGPEEIALARARLILLNEPLPRELSRFIPSIQINAQNSSLMDIKSGIFPDLWTRLQTTAQGFLTKAWLWAMFALKASDIVEDILVLELGPISKKIMHVRFQGKRRRVYSNREPSLITLEGECRLEE